MNELDLLLKIKDLIDTTEELDRLDINIDQALRNDEVLTEINSLVEDAIAFLSNKKEIGE